MSADDDKCRPAKIDGQRFKAIAVCESGRQAIGPSFAYSSFDSSTSSSVATCSMVPKNSAAVRRPNSSSLNGRSLRMMGSAFHQNSLRRLLHAMLEGTRRYLLAKT